MEKTTRDHICDSLEDLDDGQFKRFADKLVDSKLEPRTRRKAVDGKDRGDVATHLINFYTEKPAVDITIKILQAIDCNKVAKDLEGSTGISTSAANAACANVSTSGNSTQATTPATGAAFIDAKWAELVQRASGMESILDSLLMKNILTDEQYNNIMSEKTQQKMMRELIRGPLKAAGNTGKNALYEVLMVQQSCMMKDLGAQ
ncbi:apoptosis-associated speck-like protein containing a CARD [Brachyhypopomus gauderio]|uniref:apoptosis-associated speck-like protein containing a CARD n=1 Tax=Brachyhypopomus gauderio TaxID=698409 RepID=UPI00404377DD